MKKIYIDVTQLYNWRGKVTGIQRVMYEISSRFKSDEAFEPVYVMWNRNTASFYEVQFEEIESNLTLPQPGKDSRRREEYIQLFKKVYHHVPLSRTMYRVFSLSRGRIVKLRRSADIVNIEPNAILFMPHGGVWESHTYIAEILRLQASRHVKLVPILFDMCPVMLPQFVVEPVREAFENYMKQILPKSDLVLAISENTKKDALAWLKNQGLTSEVTITVFRLGDEVGGETPEPAKVPDTFALCVGTVEARKNHASLYYAYKLAAEQGEELLPLVIVGRKGWMAGDVYQLMTTDTDVKDKFIFLHSASDSQLAWLYENAQFSVYPSFYEGWGLPIAESLLRGTPCIASQTSSMKEIAGDLVDYFSPFSTDQIKEKIHLYSQDSQTLKNLKKKVSKYQTTTWDTSYLQVSEAIKKI